MKLNQNDTKRKMSKHIHLMYAIGFAMQHITKTNVHMD